MPRGGPEGTPNFRSSSSKRAVMDGLRRCGDIADSKLNDALPRTFKPSFESSNGVAKLSRIPSSFSNVECEQCGEHFSIKHLLTQKALSEKPHNNLFGSETSRSIASSANGSDIVE